MRRLQELVRAAFGPLSFRQALLVAAGLILGALVVMAASTALALAEADRLLDRLSRSQDQLTRVTSIEADLNAWLLAGSEGAAPAARRQAMADIEAQIDAYLDTIAFERSLMADAALLARQAEETARGEALVAAIRVASTSEATVEQRRAVRALAQQIEEGERAEVALALEEMRRLKARTTTASGALFALVALLAVWGALAMSRSVGRPLRLLEDAARRVGRGEAASAPVDLRGFTEIRAVTGAFNRLDEEVAAQRRALARHAEDLEAQVAARTAELEASNARLAEIDRTRRLFFSKVSHELRTPATVIRSEAEVALRRADAPAADLRESLEHVAANSAFLQRRLEDLLALARAEDGRITLKREPIRLDRLLSEVVVLAEPYTRSSGMALIEEGVDRPDLVVVGDASWLQQALLALVDNAAKFATGSPALRLSLDAEDGAATIRVADGGPGVDPDALPFLFDSFYQAPFSSETGRAHPGGAGLGLSVMRWVVEQHGGAVSARNVEGQGLLIELRLPVAA